MVIYFRLNFALFLIIHLGHIIIPPACAVPQKVRSLACSEDGRCETGSGLAKDSRNEISSVLWRNWGHCK